jgi:hypothetical protein
MRDLERVTEGSGQSHRAVVTLHGHSRHVTLELTEEGQGEGHRAEWAEAFRYAIERSRWRAAEKDQACGEENVAVGWEAKGPLEGAGRTRERDWNRAAIGRTTE